MSQIFFLIKNIQYDQCSLTPKTNDYEQVLLMDSLEKIGCWFESIWNTTL